jgi:hypothetical protein
MVGLSMSWKSATWLCRVGKSFLTTDYRFSGRVFAIFQFGICNTEQKGVRPSIKVKSGACV